MEQFSLEKWLENSSRKVVTRRGNSVRIICTDANEETPIAVLVTVNDMGQDKLATALYTKDGRYGSGNSPYDLFFADEEELTEFEKELQTIISEASHWTSEDGSISTYCQFGDKEIKKISAQVLDLARKELEKEFKDEEYFRLITEHYKKGKQDALKDLPKWKKAKKDEELDCHVAIQQDDRVVLSDFVQKDEYYITLDVLKKLPKEE